jgi:hypothetical protein
VIEEDMKTYGRIFIITSVLLSFLVTISPKTMASSFPRKIVCDEFVQYAHNQCGDGEGGVFITWADLRNGVDSDVYAQRIDVYGNIMWDTNGIPICTEIGQQDPPKICSDGEGGAIIVWADDRPAYNGIYAQRIDADGNALWNQGGTFVITGDTCLRIYSDNNGGAVIAWRNLSSSLDIYAQRIASNGSIMWGIKGIVICNAFDRQENLQFFCDNNGYSYFVWEDRRKMDSDIYAQKVDINGNILWQPNGSVIFVGEDNQMYPYICTDCEEGVIVNWYDSRLNGLVFQRINATGENQWNSNGTLLVSYFGFFGADQMISDGQGGALIIVGGFWNDLYIVRINSSAGLLYFNKFYDKDDNIVSHSLQICPDGEGGYFLAWQDGIPPDNKYNIIAQRIDGNGINLWSIHGKVVCNSPGDQKRAFVSNNGVGKAILSWETWRPFGPVPDDVNIYYTILENTNSHSISFGLIYLLFTIFSVLGLVIIRRRHC